MKATFVNEKKGMRRNLLTDRTRESLSMTNDLMKPLNPSLVMAVELVAGVECFMTMIFFLSIFLSFFLFRSFIRVINLKKNEAKF